MSDDPIREVYEKWRGRPAWSVVLSEMGAELWAAIKTHCERPEVRVRRCFLCGVPWIVNVPGCQCPGLDGDSPGSDCADPENWPSVMESCEPTPTKPQGYTCPKCGYDCTEKFPWRCRHCGWAHHDGKGEPTPTDTDESGALLPRELRIGKGLLLTREECYWRLTDESYKWRCICLDWGEMDALVAAVTEWRKMKR